MNFMLPTYLGICTQKIDKPNQSKEREPQKNKEIYFNQILITTFKERSQTFTTERELSATKSYIRYLRFSPESGTLSIIISPSSNVKLWKPFQ